MPAVTQDRQVVVSAPASDKSELVSSFSVADFPVPTGREEEWRFTPVRRIRDLLDADLTTTTPVIDVHVPDGVALEQVGRDDPRLGEVLTPTDRASVLAWQKFTQAHVVTVPSGSDLTDPIVVTTTGVDVAATHLRIIVEAGSSATVLLDGVGSGRHLSNVEVSVGDGSRLTFAVVAGWSADAAQLSRIHTRVGRDATVRQVVATFGGDVVRTVSTVDFAGPGGDVELLGAYFADAGQHLEHRLFVDHSQPHCRSNVIYKGALQGQHAHTVWIGDVLIRAAAVGTDTYEINRNLVLSDGARADSVPNLEIETGEVAGAGHASATGRFDDEQLFYLQARGIDVETARRLVVRGFFADVIEAIPVEVIRERLWQSIESEVAVDRGQL